MHKYSRIGPPTAGKRGGPILLRVTWACRLRGITLYLFSYDRMFVLAVRGGFSGAVWRNNSFVFASAPYFRRDFSWLYSQSVESYGI